MGLHPIKNMLQQTRFLQTVERDIKRNKRRLKPRVCPFRLCVQHEIEHIVINARRQSGLVREGQEIIRPNQATKAYPLCSGGT